jgi:hypothetical protein
VSQAEIRPAGVTETGLSCPYCRFPLKEGASITACDVCRSPHHSECWRENHGCAVTACAGGPDATAERATPASVSQVTAVGPAAPWGIVRPERPEQTAPLPPATPRRRRRMVWLLVAAALVLVAVAGAGAALISRDHAKGTSSTGTLKLGTPVGPSPHARFMSQVGRQLRVELVPPQRVVTTQLRAIEGAGSPYAGLLSAAARLDRQVLKTQGWVTTLHPASAADRATLGDLGAALRAQDTYASSLAALSGDPAALTHRAVNATIADAVAAEDSYVRLSGAAPTLPTMPLAAADARRLSLLIPRKQRIVPVTPVYSPSGPAAGPAIEATVQSHWNAINAGNYLQAYSYFSPRVRNESSTAESNWIADKNRDQPQSTPISFSGLNVSATSAVVDVSFQTRGHETGPGNTGCNSWSGSYSLVDVGGSWYIDSSRLERTSFTC